MARLTGLFGGALLQRFRDGVGTTEAVNLPTVAAGGIAGQLGSPVIDLGTEADDLYLILFGTGLRFRGSQDNVTASFGGVYVPVEYAGLQSVYAVVDQLNMKLPKSLAGSAGPSP